MKRFYKRHRPRGDDVTVLAGGTSAEELIEGLSNGVGFAGSLAIRGAISPQPHYRGEH